VSRLEAFANLVHEKLETLGVNLAPVFGRKNIPAHHALPRILWDRSQQACTVRYADRRAGGQKFGTEDVDPVVSRENQTLDRVEAAEVHLSAATEEKLEELFDAFCGALELVPGTVSGLGTGLSYSWLTNEHHEQRCPVIVLTVAFRVPVATESGHLVIVRAVNTEGVIVTGDE
jgi:hypothetical protein